MEVGELFARPLIQQLVPLELLLPLPHVQEALSRQSLFGIFFYYSSVISIAECIASLHCIAFIFPGAPPKNVTTET